LNYKEIKVKVLKPQSFNKEHSIINKATKDQSPFLSLSHIFSKSGSVKPPLLNIWGLASI